MIPCVLLGCAVVSLTLTHAYPILKTKLSRKELEIAFPNECNLETKEGYPFKRSSSPLFSGRPRPNKKSLHQFFIGIFNCNTQKTLRNVRLFIECRTYGSIFTTYLICERTHSDAVDILPQMTDYFMLGQGIDDSDSGMFHPRINPDQDYLNFFDLMETQKHVGFVIFGTQRRPALLKNNGLRLVARAFADDTPPEECEFRLDLKDRITLTKLS